jgi:hypothetical protein
VRDERAEPVSVLIRKKLSPETQERWAPKAGHERVIPLTAEAKAIVMGKVAESTTPWLFEARANAKGLVGKWTPDRLRDHFKVCLKASGIDQGSPHVLRHTFASFLAKTMPLPCCTLFGSQRHPDDHAIRPRRRPGHRRCSRDLRHRPSYRQVGLQEGRRPRHGTHHQR